MKKINILINLLFVFAGISVFDINAAARIVVNTEEKQTIEDANKLLLNGIKDENISLVKAALLIGADVNIKNEYGNTALMQAAIYSYTDIFNLLLDHGADISIKNNNKHTVFDFVTKNPVLMSAIFKDYQRIRKQIAASLVPDKKEAIELANTLLLNSAANGNLNILKKAIELGANLEVRDKEGATALINASLNGFASIVEQLIESNADINAKNSSGCTSLMYSFDRGLPEIAELLLKKGADVDIENEKGQTAFDLINGNSKLEAIFKKYYELQTPEENRSSETKEIEEQIKAEDKDTKVETQVQSEAKAAVEQIKVGTKEEQAEAEQDEAQKEVEAKEEQDKPEEELESESKDVAEQAEIEQEDEPEEIETPEPQIQTCEKCGIELPSDELKKHKKQHNKIKTKNICKQGICQKATSYFATKQELSAHTKKFHKHESKVAKEISEKQAKKSAENICDLCGVKCANSKSLKLHKSNHDKIETEHICNVDTCEKAPSYFKKKSELSTHQEQCHDIKHQNPQKPKKIKEPKKEETKPAPKIESESKELKDELTKHDISYLKKCMKNGKTEEIKKFLKGANVNALADALCIAHQHANLDMIQLIIDLGANVNAKDSKGHSLLPIIVNSGDISLVELFLKNGANPNAKNDGHSALINALKKSYNNIPGLLLKHGANVHDTDEDGNPAILISSKKGNHGLVNLLLEHKAEVDARDRNGNTPLIAAAQISSIEVAKILLKRGANVNATNMLGETALSITTKEGVLDFAKLLLENGADINNDKNIDGDTVLIQTIKRSLAKNVKGEYFYPRAIPLIKLFLQFKADINIKNKLHESALTLATDLNLLEIVQLLLNQKDQKVDVNIKRKDGQTPLMIAITKPKSEKIVKLLLKNGADVNVQSEAGTPLTLAVTYKLPNIVKLLLEKKADVDIRITANNVTPLMFAAKLKDKEMIDILLKAGANVNAVTKFGDTPLLFAIESGDEKIVELLLENKADPNIKYPENNSALIFATKIGNYKMVELLLKAGAKVNHQNITNTSALVIAFLSGNERIMKLLKDYGA